MASKDTPLSPALSSNEALPSGFDELAQYNADNSTMAVPTSHPRESDSRIQQQQPTMEAIHAASQPGSRYGTPAPSLPLPQQQYLEPSTMQYPDPNYGAGQYPYPPETPSVYPVEGLPQMDHSTPAYNTPSASPQTILRSGPITRTGGASAGIKALGVQNGIKVVKTPPARKKKERTKAPRKVASITQPLSELTKDWEEPIVDIEAYVNRSTEVRLQEVREGKVPGKIKRPMNGFMLYRKAFQNRTKIFCSHNNHQIVSQVCGESWDLEAPEFRQKYIDWSVVERMNHALAHPGYKFTPSKPKSKAKVPSASPEVDYASSVAQRTPHMGVRDDDSDLPTWGWDADSRFTSRTHTPVDNSDGEWVPPRSMQQQYRGGLQAQYQQHPQHNHQVRSTFHYSNPNKPLPAAYNNADLGSGMYYQQSMMPNANGPGGYVEDITIHKTQSPSMAGVPMYSQPQHPNNVVLDILHNNVYNTPQMQMAPRSVGMQQGAYDQQAYHPQSQQQQQSSQQQHQQTQHAAEDLLDPAMFGQEAVDGLGSGWGAMGSEEAAAAGVVISAGGDTFVGYNADLEQQEALLKGNAEDWHVTDVNALDDSWVNDVAPPTSA